MRIFHKLVLVIALSFLFIGSVDSMSVSSLCEEPQKGFFISFHALSKSDSIPTLFKEIDLNLKKNYTLTY